MGQLLHLRIVFSPQICIRLVGHFTTPTWKNMLVMYEYPGMDLCCVCIVLESINQSVSQAVSQSVALSTLGSQACCSQSQPSGARGRIHPGEGQHSAWCSLLEKCIHLKVVGGGWCTRQWNVILAASHCGFEKHFSILWNDYIFVHFLWSAKHVLFS